MRIWGWIGLAFLLSACVDRDPRPHARGQQCGTPAAGCACNAGEPPIACFDEKTTADDGTVMCHEGTRYCRDGSWSACESVVSYPLSSRDDSQRLIDPDAGAEHCNDCDINCFVVRDNLDPTDGGITSDNSDSIQLGDGGGLSLLPLPPPDDAGQDAQTYDPSGCVLGVAPDSDCDGLLDQIDPYPLEKPFATTNPAIFLNIGPGETQTGVIDLQFFMHTVDVYFLIDQTDTMQSVRNKLKSTLTTGSYLGADVECADIDLDHQANNELKAKGVLGAIRCLMRNASFGLGFSREVPFDPYGDDDEITFKHLMDISSDENAAIAAINTMEIDRDLDWPDAQALALYALATGKGFYLGVDRPGVLPRVGCPEDTWGYACFREEAIPVIVLLTDSAQHNGPPLVGRDYRYAAASLAIDGGTPATYLSLPITNEDFATAYDFGDIASKLVTAAGNTGPMAADLGTSPMACIGAGEDAAPDAAFTFTLSQPATVSFSTQYSDFEAGVGLFTHLAAAPVDYTSDDTNEHAATTFDLGSQSGAWNQVSGDTSSMAADYAAGAVGCGADAASPDAVYRFTLTEAAKVSLDASGSSFGTAIALYDAVPATLTGVPVTNTNDDFASAHDLGTVDGRLLATTGATTSAAGIDADYLQAQVGCGADSAASDAVFALTLAQPARLQLDTAGSSFDTVLSLASGVLSERTDRSASNTNDLQSSAEAVGELGGSWYRYTGSTVPLTADYRDEFVGCGSTTSSRDAVYTFSLASPTRVRLDTAGSGFDTVLSLHDGDVDPVTTTAISANTNETATTATGVFDLGVMNDRWHEYAGGSTATMAADYEGATTGCFAESAAKDAVFRFALDAATTVRIDSVGSSFDTVLSLHDAPPPRDVTTAIATPQETYVVGSISGKSLVFTGSTAAMASDWGGEAMGCSASDDARDARFELTVDANTTLEVSTDGSSFDTSIGLFPAAMLDPKRPAATAIANDNESITNNPKAVDGVDGTWQVFSGSTKLMANDLPAFGCGAAAAAPDAVFELTLSSARTVVIDTVSANTAFDTVLGLFDGAGTYLTCDNDGGGGTYSKLTAGLAAGVYYVAVKGRSGGGKGNYTLSVRDAATSNQTACDNDAIAANGASKLTAAVTPGTYYVLLKGTSASASGSYKIRFRDVDQFAVHHRLACDDNGAGGTASRIEQALSAGTYYVVVKGLATGDNGAYKLSVRDVASGVPTSHRVACSDDDGAATSSRIEADLAAGTYHVVVKGKSSTGGAYALELQDLDPVGLGGALACNDDDGGGKTSRIEYDFPSAGTYYVIVKGHGATDAGDYTLHVTDLTGTAAAPASCSSSGGAGGAALLEETLPAGTYYAIVKGTSAAAQGAYTLRVRDTTTTTRQLLTCDDDGSFTQALARGQYDLVLKGKQSDQAGAFALTIGGGTTQAGTFKPPTWEATLAALKARNIRVTSVLNCHDEGGHGDGRSCDQAVSQAQTLANATGALGLNLEPLVVNLDDASGAGVQQAIVDHLRSLTAYLAMNVSVRVVFEPDANPGFQVSVSAVDNPGDGCDGVVGVEHQSCVPGATPTFHLDFTNPIDDPVPKNPNDPNGGYTFRAELIANGKYLVDIVPIYVIPEDVVDPGPPEPVLPAMGSYWQDLSSPGCTGNRVPDWRDLTWSADIPTGTSVVFSACGGFTLEELAGCAYETVATVTGGAACTDDSQCTNGFCAASGFCQTVVSGSCASDSDCVAGTTCVANSCYYPGQPVNVGNALELGNFKTYMRIRITLMANVATNTGPTVYDWAMTYLCTNNL